MGVFFRFFSIVLLILCVSGCGNYRNMYIKDIKGFEKGEKGIVFFDMKKVDEGCSKEQCYSTDYKIQGLDDNLEPTKMYFTGPTVTTREDGRVDYVNLSGHANYYLNALFLEPGIYYIDKITLSRKYTDSHVITKYLPEPGYEDEVVKYGAFKVEGGKAIALGALYIDADNSSLLFKKEDDKIIKDLQGTEYSYLIDKLESGVFYTRGSVILLDNDNKPQIIPSNVMKKIKEDRKRKLIKKKMQELEGRK